MAKYIKEIPQVWEEPVEQWSKRLVAFGRSERTVQTRIAVIRMFAREVRMAPELVTEEIIIEWASTKNWAAETRHSKYCSLRQFFTWFSMREGIDSPTDNLPTIRRPLQPARPIPDGTLAGAISRANPRIKLIFRLAGNYGLRAGEISKVNAFDIGKDLLGWTLVVHGKGNKDREIPISQAMVDDLLAQADPVTGWVFLSKHGGHISARWVSKIASKALPHGWTLHALRHRCATRAYQEGHDLIAVKTLLGHEKLSTTQRYILPNIKAVRKTTTSIEI